MAEYYKIFSFSNFYFTLSSMVCTFSVIMNILNLIDILTSIIFIKLFPITSDTNIIKILHLNLITIKKRILI